MMQTDTAAAFWPVMQISSMLQEDDRNEYFN